MKKRKRLRLSVNLFFMVCLFVSILGPAAGHIRGQGGDSPAGQATSVYGAIDNITVQCVQGVLENPGTGNQLEVGTTDFNRYSYIKFEVPAAEEPVASAILRLTVTASSYSPNLGVFAGPNDWPAVSSMSPPVSGESVQAASARNCPGVSGEALDTYSQALTVGETVELDVSSMVTGPGIYTAVLKVTDQTPTYKFAAMNHETEAYWPQLTVTTGTGDTGGSDGVTTPYGAIDNITVQCVMGTIENSGTGSTIKVGTTDFNRYSYLKFDVPTGDEPITSAILRLTATQSVESPKLGVYSGPNEWPSGSTTSPPASGEPAQTASARNCPNVSSTLLDNHVTALSTGDVVELNVSSLVKEPGAYTLVLRILGGEQTSAYTFASKSHTNEAYRPQLLVTTGGNPDTGGGDPGGPQLPEGCDIWIPSDNQRIWDGNNMMAKPGDNVCVEAGMRPSALRFNNFHGTAEAPITFRNYGGVVTIETDRSGDGAAMIFADSSHFILTGTGDAGAQYGFRMSARDANGGLMGLKIGYKSTDFTVENVEVYGAGFAGFMIKTDPVSTDPGTQRSGFVQNNTVIRNNYVHDTDGEGMYIGHTWHNRLYQNMWVHELHGLEVYNNILKNTGWDGLQIAAATRDVKIYNNHIENYGLEKATWQDNGLQIGPGTVGDFYNNKILYGKGGGGAGINNQGNGDLRIFNNLIVDSVTTGFISMARVNPEDPQYDGLKPIHFMHNTIINPGIAEGIESYGIWFWNSKAANTGNTAYNNLIVFENVENDEAAREYIALWPGDPVNPDPYNGGEIDLALGGNYLADNLEELRFIDAANGDYRLQPASPAVDYGADLSGFSWAAVLASDLGGGARPTGAGYDAGAFESPADGVPPVQERVLLKGPASAAAGDSLKLTLSLDSVTTSVYAKSATIQYDLSRLSFVGAASLVDGFTVLGSTYGNGQVRIIEAGAGRAVTGTLDLLELEFQVLPAIEPATTSVILKEVQVANAEGKVANVGVGPAHVVAISKPTSAVLDELIAEAQAVAAAAPVSDVLYGHYKQQALDQLEAAIAKAIADTANAASAGELHQIALTLADALEAFRSSTNQNMSLGDLGMMASHYDTTSENTIWSKVHMYDLNHNLRLDIEDLSTVAWEILNE